MIKKVILGLYVLLFLSGCADNVDYQLIDPQTTVGFLHGVWHGFISPIAFLCSLFDDSVSIYAIYNNGGWYDFGFLIGLGGLSSSK